MLVTKVVTNGLSDECKVEERDGDKLVRFNGNPFVFRLDDDFSIVTRGRRREFTNTATRRYMGDSISWTLYMLTLKDGNKVSLKKLEYQPGGMRWFEKKANALEKIRHPNLLAVWGYYIGKRGPEMSLVLEVMPKGSLRDCLHSAGGGTEIDWPTRMNIAMGIARGLNYIHNDIKVIHGNLTSLNIYLDDNTNAKISDYELSRFTAYDKNCFPYSIDFRAPEISYGFERVNTKSDVYSLGVILLELLTGEIPGSYMFHVKDMPKWAASTMKKKGPFSVLDRGLVSDASGVTNEQVATLLLALDCVKLSPEERPEVKEVLHKLEEIKVDVDAGGTSYSAPAIRKRWWQ